MGGKTYLLYDEETEVSTLQRLRFLFNKTLEGGYEHEEHRSGPRWLCRRCRLGGRLQDPEEGRLQGEHRPESDDSVGGRCRGDQGDSCCSRRTGGSRRTLLWRSSYH